MGRFRFCSSSINNCKNSHHHFSFRLDTNHRHFRSTSQFIFSLKEKLMRCFTILLSVFVAVTSAVTLADFYRLRIAARRNSRDPHSVQSYFPGFERYPSYTIDDSGRFFITRPKIDNSTGIPSSQTVKDLVPSSFYYSHPKMVAPPPADLPMSIRNEAYFINRRIYGIH